MEKLSKTNSLVNLSNSILKFYGLETYHESMKDVDSLLNSRKNKKVTIILLDAMGKVTMEYYKEYIPFIYSHIHKEFRSIYPPTTTAATTALLSGRFPIETGYVGWSQYFDKYDTIIDVFHSIASLSRENIIPSVTTSLLPYTSIIDLINATGKYTARQIMGFDYEKGDHEYDLETFFNEADNALDNYDFNYIYHPLPDSHLHRCGFDNEVVPQTMRTLDQYVERLVKNHPDTLFLLIADHGMVNINIKYVGEFDDFASTLERPFFAIEGRFAGFFVKNKGKFLEAYNKYYKDKYILKTREELLNENVFGYSEDKPNKYFLETLGDYFLLANSDACFSNRENSDLKGNHAGVTTEELALNLCVFNNDK